MSEAKDDAINNLFLKIAMVRYEEEMENWKSRDPNNNIILKEKHKAAVKISLEMLFKISDLARVQEKTIAQSLENIFHSRFAETPQSQNQSSNSAANSKPWKIENSAREHFINSNTISNVTTKSTLSFGTSKNGDSHLQCEGSDSLVKSKSRQKENGIRENTTNTTSNVTQTFKPNIAITSNDGDSQLQSKTSDTDAKSKSQQKANDFRENTFIAATNVTPKSNQGVVSISNKGASQLQSKTLGSIAKSESAQNKNDAKESTSKIASHVIPNSNTSITNSSNTEEKAVLNVIRDDMRPCIQEGVQKYKSIFDDLLRHKHPLKYSQLVEYHDLTLDAIKNAMFESFKFSGNSNENNNIMIQTKSHLTIATARLETLIKAQFKDIYLRKHEIIISGVVKAIKGFTNAAEMHYDEAIESFIFEGSTWKEIASAHERFKEKAIDFFDGLLKQNQPQLHDIDFVLRSDLEEKLKERFNELESNFNKDESHCGTQAKQNTQNVTTRRQCAMIKNSEPKLSMEINPESGHTSLMPLPQELYETLAAMSLNKPIASAKIRSQEAPLSKSMDIGLYIDESFVKIGGYQSQENEGLASSGKFTELVEYSPHLCFTETNIVLGKEALQRNNSENCNYFNIFELITSTKPSLPSILNTEEAELTLCSHKIIGVYFHTLFREAENKSEDHAKIGKIVVTIPFTPSSSAKEMIRESARTAGYRITRIVPTLITATVAKFDLDYSVKSKHEMEDTYLKEKSTEKENSTESVLIFNYQRNYFSLGIVEKSPTSTCLKVSYGFDNIAECDDTFWKSHHKMYENGFQNLKLVEQDRVRKIYDKAIKFVLAKAWKPIGKGIILQYKHCEFVVQKMKEIINEKKLHFFNASWDPLLGASFLASVWSRTETFHTDEEAASSMSTFKVGDYGRSTLSLSLRNEDTTMHDISNQIIEEGIVFSKKFNFEVSRNIKIPTKINFQFQEKFGNKNWDFQTCSYSLTLVSDGSQKEKAPYSSKEEVKVTIECCMDQDGVFSLRTKTLEGDQNDLGMLRTDNLTCTCNPDRD